MWVITINQTADQQSAQRPRHICCSSAIIRTLDSAGTWTPRSESEVSNCTCRIINTKSMTFTPLPESRDVSWGLSRQAVDHSKSDGCCSLSGDNFLYKSYSTSCGTSCDRSLRHIVPCNNNCGNGFSSCETYTDSMAHVAWTHSTNSDSPCTQVIRADTRRRTGSQDYTPSLNCRRSCTCKTLRIEKSKGSNADTKCAILDVEYCNHDGCGGEVSLSECNDSGLGLQRADIPTVCGYSENCYCMLCSNDDVNQLAEESQFVELTSRQASKTDSYVPWRSAAATTTTTSVGSSRQTNDRILHWRLLLLLALILPSVRSAAGTTGVLPTLDPLLTNISGEMVDGSINITDDTGLFGLLSATSTGTLQKVSITTSAVDLVGPPYKDNNTSKAVDLVGPPYKDNNTSKAVEDTVDGTVVVNEKVGSCKGSNCLVAAAQSGPDSSSEAENSVHMERIKMMLIPIVTVGTAACVLVVAYCMCRYKKCVCCQRQLDKCNSICDRCMRGDFGSSGGQAVMVGEEGELEALDAGSLAPTMVSGHSTNSNFTRQSSKQGRLSVPGGGGANMYVFRHPSHPGTVGARNSGGVSPGRLCKSLQQVSSTGGQKSRGSRRSLQSQAPASRSDSIHRLLGGPPRTGNNNNQNNQGSGNLRSTSFGGCSNVSAGSRVQHARSHGGASGSSRSAQGQSTAAGSRHSSTRSLTPSNLGGSQEVPKGFIPPLRPF